MSRDSEGNKVGFHHPAHRRRAMRRRAMPVPELIASVALAACTALAVTVVSIEIAEADSFAFGAGVEPSGLALATFLGLLLAVMGGITVSRSLRRR
jgi:putative exporter of polyketide antibiotics